MKIVNLKYFTLFSLVLHSSCGKNISGNISNATVYAEETPYIESADSRFKEGSYIPFDKEVSSKNLLRESDPLIKVSNGRDKKFFQKTSDPTKIYGTTNNSLNKTGNSYVSDDLLKRKNQKQILLNHEEKNERVIVSHINEPLKKEYPNEEPVLKKSSSAIEKKLENESKIVTIENTSTENSDSIISVSQIGAQELQSQSLAEKSSIYPKTITSKEINENNAEVTPKEQEDNSEHNELKFLDDLKLNKEAENAFFELKELCKKRKSLQSQSWSNYNKDYADGKNSLKKLELYTGVDLKIDNYTPIQFIKTIENFLFKIDKLYEEYKNNSISIGEIAEGIDNLESVLNSSISLIYVLNTHLENGIRRYVDDGKDYAKARLSTDSTRVILGKIFLVLESSQTIREFIIKNKEGSQDIVKMESLKTEAAKKYAKRTHPDKLTEQKAVLDKFAKTFGIPQNLPKEFDKDFSWKNYIEQNNLDCSSALATLIKNEDLRNANWNSNLPKIFRFNDFNKRVDVLINNLYCCVPVFNKIIGKISEVVDTYKFGKRNLNSIEEINIFVTELRKTIKEAKEDENYKQIDKNIDNWIQDIRKILCKETLMEIQDRKRNGPTRGLAYAGKWIPNNRDRQISQTQFYNCMDIISSMTAIRVFLESNGTMNLRFNILSADLPDHLYETVEEQKSREDADRSERYANLLYTLFIVQAVPNIVPGLKTVATLAAIGFASINLLNNHDKIHLMQHTIGQYLTYYGYTETVYE